MILVRIFSACICLSFAAAEGALAQDWIVDQVIQPAQFTLASDPDGVLENDGHGPSAPDEGDFLLVAARHADVEWNDLAPGMTLPNGSWIRTGETGRLQLRRGEEMIQFKPGTTASIVTWTEGDARLTDVEQRSGSIFFDVETRDTKHTLVETGLLAALVKGTRFSVNYDEETAALRVEHGIVEAVDLVRMERVDVRERQSVEVSRANPEPMTVRGPGPKDEVTAVGSDDAAEPEKIRFVPEDAPAGGLAEALASQESAMAFRRAALIEERRAARIAARQAERRAGRVEERRFARVEERMAARIEERREERVIARQEERRSARLAERIAERQDGRVAERQGERVAARQEERREDRVAERQAERVAARQEERRVTRIAERRAARQAEQAAAGPVSDAQDSPQAAQTSDTVSTSKDGPPGSSGDAEESASAPGLEPQPSSSHEASEGSEHPDPDAPDTTEGTANGAFEHDDAADEKGESGGAGSIQPGTVGPQPVPLPGDASTTNPEAGESGAQPGADPDASPPPAGQTVDEASENDAGAPTSGAAGDGGDGADTDDRPGSSDGLSPEERRAQRVAERQAARQAEREAERQAEQVADGDDGATPTPHDMAGGDPNGIGETSAAYSESQDPATGENSPPGDNEAAWFEGGTSVANAPAPGIVDPGEQNDSSGVAAGASSHTLAQEVSPGQETGSSPTDDPSYGSNAAPQPPTAQHDANETAEERRESRAAERQAQRQEERAAERQAERQAEPQPEGQAPQDGEVQPPDPAGDGAGNVDETFDIVARGLSGSTLLPLLADLDLLSVVHSWPDDARRSSGSDAEVLSLARQDIADALFRLIEEAGLRAMMFEADGAYDLLFDAEAASIFDPGQDQPRFQVRATFAPAAAPDIAPVPLPAPGRLLVAAVIGLGALRSASRPRYAARPKQ